MRVAVHDMHGYTFVRDFAAELAHTHQVTFITCDSVESPNQLSGRTAAGASNVRITLRRRFPKYAIARRVAAELHYGRLVYRAVKSASAEAVISANAPLLSQWVIARGCRRSGVSFVFWLQDLYGRAASEFLASKIPAPLARAIAAPFGWLEGRILRKSDYVVVIGSSLQSTVIRLGIDPSKVALVANWTNPLTMRALPSDRSWLGISGAPPGAIFVYSGTLGRKHPLVAITRLAATLDRAGDRALVVYSEGSAADWLANQSIPSVRVLPFQAESVLNQILCAADVLVLALTDAAAKFSVPSKMYTYLATGRPVLAIVPHDSEVAALIRKIDCGVVVDPIESDFAEALVILGSSLTRQRMGRNARSWAEDNMSLVEKTRALEEVLVDAAATQGRQLRGVRPELT